MKLIIHKFKRLENLTVNVPAQITGGNEVGKTTILEAISFILTGKDQQGNEFKTIYDNRVDLHDAIADVSYFDSYGNEFRRTVQPVFQTSRAGVEEVKILRSTRCMKNKIDVKDFASEFSDFYKFGTDYFFRLTENEQRAVFIDLMKSKLPDYDVRTAQLEFKSLKKTQKETIKEIDTLRNLMKELKNQEVPEISEELQNQENEYQKFMESFSDNRRLISEINRRNNGEMAAFQSKKMALIILVNNDKAEIEHTKKAISQLKTDIDQENAMSFSGYLPTEDPAGLIGKIERLKNQIKELTYYSDLDTYAKSNWRTEPVVIENNNRVKRLKEATPDNLPDGEELTDVCFDCGTKSQKVLDMGVNSIIEKLRAENRQILMRAMKLDNDHYLTISDELDRAEKKLRNLQAENMRRKEKEASDLRAFQLRKTNRIEELKDKISEKERELKIFEKNLEVIKNDLSKLEEPTLENLPTEMEISEELKNAHSEFLSQKEAIVGVLAVNRHNGMIKNEKTAEIKEKQADLMQIESNIIELQNEISDYFSNLKGVVEKEFSGKIKISVELLEYVMSRDEYKDVFKITADGKVFPHECNGALINNVKLQVLATLQRLSGYTGITILDNAEANTTQQVDASNLQLVSARATDDEKLIINN